MPRLHRRCGVALLVGVTFGYFVPGSVGQN